MISCVTVHDSQDSDSSTCSPLSPKRLPNFAEGSGQGSKSLAVVMPSLKTQPWEGETSGTASSSSSSHSNPDKTMVLLLFSHFVFFPFVYFSEQSSTISGKLKKTSALQSSRSGLPSSERPQRTVTTKSQPLNLSQVEPLRCRTSSHSHTLRNQQRFYYIVPHLSIFL